MFSRVKTLNGIFILTFLSLNAHADPIKAVRVRQDLGEAHAGKAKRVKPGVGAGQQFGTAKPEMDFESALSACEQYMASLGKSITFTRPDKNNESNGGKGLMATSEEANALVACQEKGILPKPPQPSELSPTTLPTKTIEGEDGSYGYGAGAAR